MPIRLLSVILPILLAVSIGFADDPPITIEGWGTIIDPDRDCSVTIKNGLISIHVPEGAHDLSAELNRLNAPRMLQEVSGSFSIDVRVSGEFVTGEATIEGRTAYNGAGLLLWQDERNYIRLERAALKRSGRVQHYVNFEQRVDGRIVQFGTPLDFQVDETRACDLRLERKDAQINASVRQGDDPWQALLPKSSPLPIIVKVGVTAINASDAPFEAHFSNLRLSSNTTTSAKSTPVKDQDPYEVPDSNVEDLVAFVKKIKEIRPRTRDEYTTHSTRSPEALATAAERILKFDDAPPEARELAQRILFEPRVNSVSRLAEADQRSFLDEVLAFSAKGDANEENGKMLFTLARGLESAQRTEMASEAYLAASELVKTSDSQGMAQMAEKLAGSARRMKLLGNEMEIHGKRADGEDFDLESYRGKVVLVDFWATWCGPCVAELPNVKKYYELYHDDGFEVVGVCLDTSREKLESFVEARKVPWINLFEDNAGWDHPVANHYGIMAIPTVILINAEGKVVSLKARGPELGRLLQEELGPIDPERLREVEEKLRNEMPASGPRLPVPVVQAPAPMIIYQDSAVYLSKLDGSEFSRVARDNGYQWHGGPVISPDGSRLAWDAHRRGLTSPAVFIADTQGKVTHKLEGLTRPTWLSDSVLLAERSGKLLKVDIDADQKEDVLLEGSYGSLSSNRRYLILGRDPETVVRDLETDEQQVVRLQPSPRSFNGFAVSNDGKQIAYVALEDRGEGIYVADVADGKGKLVANEKGSEHFPRFSPDGKRLMFTAGSLDLGDDLPISRIYVVDLASGESKAITPDDFHCRDGSWSGDGDTVAFVAVAKSAVEASPKHPPRTSVQSATGPISNVLKRIGLALHNHHAAYKQLPPNAARVSPNLSWRVHLLPFLDEAALYREFKLDEPWDSEHNVKLVERIPNVFASASPELATEGKTRIVLPFHDKAIYHDRQQGAKFREVLDGLSNTIAAVVADEENAVIWTRPDDLEIDLDQPRKGWSKGLNGVVSVLFADGAVIRLPDDVSDELVSNLLTRAGREVIDLDRSR